MMNLKNNKAAGFYAVLIGICLVNMLAMLRFGGKISLWGDEVAQLGYINKGFSFGDIVNVYLHEEITNLPLFPMVAAVWYRLCPFGERWLYIVCIIPVAAGVYFTGLAAKELRDERCGILAALFTAISYYLIKDGGLNFRAYGFTFCFGAIAAYFYVRYRADADSEIKSSIKNKIPLGIAFVFFAYSNYFACLVIVSYFICDFIFWLLKKVHFSAIVSYIIPGVLLSPWFIAMLILHERKLSEFWPDVPTLADIPDVLRYLTNRQELLFVILLLAMLYSVLCFFKALADHKTDLAGSGIPFVFTFNFWFVALLVFVYSAYINPQGGFFVKRYFLAILPQMYILMAAFVMGIFDRLTKSLSDKRNLVYLLLISFIFCYFGLENYMLVREKKLESRDFYRESAVFLADRDDLYDEDTLVLVWDSKYRYAGFADYYISHYENVDELRISRKGDKDLENRLRESRVVYLVTPTASKPDKEFLKLLDGFSAEKFEDCGVIKYSREIGK